MADILNLIRKSISRPSSSVLTKVPIYAKAKPKLQYGRYGTRPGCLAYPKGLAVCPTSGNIVVSDWGAHKIHVLSPDLKHVRSAGDHGLEDGEFNCPSDVAVNSRNMIFVSSCHRIQVLDSHGKFLRRFGSEGAGYDELNSPHGLAFDEDDNLYVCDSENYRVVVFNSEGKYVREFGGRDDLFERQPMYMAVCRGRVVVTDRSGQIHLFTTTGQHVKSVKSVVDAAGVVCDHDGNVIATDRPGRLVVLSRDLEFMTVVGQGQGQLKFPLGVAVTHTGDLVVSEPQQARVQLWQIPRV